MYSINDYDYDLPEGRIAQMPVDERDQSRLLFLRRKSGRLSHHKFYDICDLLSPSDILVVNNTRVVPARLFGRKETGGKAEVLIIDYARGSRAGRNDGRVEYECLIRASKRPQIGASIHFQQGLDAVVRGYQEGVYTVQFSFSGDFESILDRVGNVPLPPYIRRGRTDEYSNDRTAYQTIYASKKGAVAAPTAGLHFTESLLEKMEARGLAMVTITLHVGYGTFLPVRTEDIRGHRIHPEWYRISEAAADMINRMKAGGCRIVAVGTTCVRTLEYAADDEGHVAHGSGSCDLFIYPGYKFNVVDAMITNFHLPKSTLLMLVSAFAGRENVLDAYRQAIEMRYRFYSYGDAMLIA